VAAHRSRRANRFIATRFNGQLSKRLEWLRRVSAGERRPSWDPQDPARVLTPPDCVAGA
jgi:hypothetical protein